MFFRTLATQDTLPVLSPTSDTTLSSDQDVYKLIVPAGVTLTIADGVTVRVVMAEVNGSLINNGQLTAVQALAFSSDTTFLQDGVNTRSAGFFKTRVTSSSLETSPGDEEDAGFFETRRSTGNLNSYPS